MAKSPIDIADIIVTIASVVVSGVKAVKKAKGK